MRWRSFVVASTIVLISIAITQAQQHSYSGAGGGFNLATDMKTPQAQIIERNSGYDPFQWNSTSGRFDYVPVPYDASSAGDPYRFNSFTGRWDYAPTPPPEESNFGMTRDPTPSNYIDTRVNNVGEPQTASATIPPDRASGPPIVGTSPNLAQPAGMPAASPRQPTTRAATSPVQPHSPPPPMCA